MQHRNKVTVPYRSSRPLRGSYSQFGAMGCPPTAVGRSPLGMMGAAAVGVAAPAAIAAPLTAAVGPLAQSMRAMLAKGMAPKLVLLSAMQQLQKQGEKIITADIQNQLKLGLTNPAGKFLGSLGYGGSGVTSAAGGATTGASLGSAFPVVGTVIGAAVGAIVGEAAHLLQRHVGKAEASWTSPGFYASLNNTQGRDYDEKQFSEAFKGMMDTGNNIVPGCGADRHKDPDCLLGPMANIIAQGYLTGVVPLSATTQDVFSKVVVPWLQTGVGGLVNWKTLATEPVQMLMMKAAADRYLAGEAMTRGDMPAYQNQGKKTPSLVQMLGPILQTAPVAVAPTPTYAPTPSGAIATQPVIQSSPIQSQVPVTTPVTVTGTTQSGSAIVPVNQTDALIQQMMAQGASQQAAMTAAMASLQAQGINTSSPQVQQQLQSAVQASTAGGTTLPVWLGIGAAVVAMGFALARPQKRGR